MGTDAQTAPVFRIGLAPLDSGAKLTLIALWCHANWNADSRRIPGFVHVSSKTLAKRVGCSQRSVKNHLQKLREKGYIVSLRELGQAERHIANHVRESVKVKNGRRLAPLACRCGLRPRECSCRVLRPISAEGHPLRDLPGAPLEMNGLHSLEPRAKAKAKAKAKASLSMAPEPCRSEVNGGRVPDNLWPMAFEEVDLRQPAGASPSLDSGPPDDLWPDELSPQGQ